MGKCYGMDVVHLNKHRIEVINDEICISVVCRTY